MEPVSSVLEQLIGQLASPEWLKNVLKVKWKQIVGDKLAKVTQVSQVRGQVVTVVAKTSTVAHELQFRKDELRRRIRETAQFEPSDIRIRIGSIASEVIPKQLHRLEQELERIVLTAKEQAFIEKTVAPIKDVGLRQQISHVLEQFIKLNYWKKRHGFKECKRCKSLYLGNRIYCPVCRIELRRYLSRN